MPRKSKAVRVELLPRQTEAPDLAALVAQAVDKKLAESFSSDDLFQPFFRSRKDSRAIKETQTVPEQHKWTNFFEDYGCLKCESRSNYQGLGMYSRCYTKVLWRLRASIAKRAPEQDKPLPMFVDTMKMARIALAPSLAALTAGNESKGSPRFFSRSEAAAELGITTNTLTWWVRSGKLAPATVHLSATQRLWTEDDIARVRQYQATKTRGAR